MIVFRNGSLTREEVCSRIASGSWDEFGNILGRTAAGNGGHVGLYFSMPEITPLTRRSGSYVLRPGQSTMQSVGNGVPLSAEVEARALIEGHVLSMYAHSKTLGIDCSRIIVTGGASENSEIVKVISDVFAKPCYGIDQSDSASLGAALRAAHAVQNAVTRVPWGQFLESVKLLKYKLLHSPNAESHAAHMSNLARYELLERMAVTAMNSNAPNDS